MNEHTKPQPPSPPSGGLTLTTEEEGVALSLIIEAHGHGLTRSAFDEVARDFVSHLGVRDRLWACYLLARPPGSFYRGSI